MLAYMLRRFCSSGCSAVVMSGIQPTGRVHIGNYFGAVVQWLKLQADLQRCRMMYLLLADLHALTAFRNPDQLKRDIVGMATTLIACGLRAPRCVLFQQSSVAEHAEMYWLLGCFLTLPQLQHLSHYREKAASYRQGDIPLPLLTYPVLQAADILLYKPGIVPVGEDQTQHLRLAQKLAKSVRAKYGDPSLFPTPKQLMSSYPRIKSLRDPSKKMSKSDSDVRACLFVDDSADVIVDKVKKAVTDCIGAVTYEPDTRPGVANLIRIYAAATEQQPSDIVSQYVGRTTAQFKLDLAEVLVEKFRPIRRSMKELLKDQQVIRDILDAGGRTASAQAMCTVADFKQLIGLRI